MAEHGVEWTFGQGKDMSWPILIGWDSGDFLLAGCLLVVASPIWPYAVSSLCPSPRETQSNELWHFPRSDFQNLCTNLTYRLHTYKNLRTSE